MLITARFDGRCAQCGKPTIKGEAIDYQGGKAYHPDCAPPEEDASAIADRLGYTHMETP